MSDNIGARPSETGSRASHEAAKASSPSGFDPARWWAALGEEAATDIPYVMQVGRYAFFTVCAFGFGVVVSLPLVPMGLSRDFAHTIASVSSVAAFFALRDMSKPWDVARKAVAIAMETREGGNEVPSRSDDSAGRKASPTPSLSSQGS